MQEYPMKQLAKDVREVMSQAATSKEAALKFLKEAGILDITNNTKDKALSKTAKKK